MGILEGLEMYIDWKQVPETFKPRHIKKELCISCNVKRAVHYTWDGSFCDDCLKGLAEDYYAFSPGDTPNEQ